MRLAVDIGGTFTDVVAFDDTTGKVTYAKTLSRPSEPARGVQEGLRKSGLPLTEADTFIHGSTVVVNAVIERKGAKTALITTEGFRDVYEIGRINRPDSFNPKFSKHKPLIPRSHIFEVEERYLGNGTEHLPLNEENARAVVRTIKDRGFDAVGVLFLPIRMSKRSAAPAWKARRASSCRPRWLQPQLDDLGDARFGQARHDVAHLTIGMVAGPVDQRGRQFDFEGFGALDQIDDGRRCDGAAGQKFRGGLLQLGPGLHQVLRWARRT